MFATKKEEKNNKFKVCLLLMGEEFKQAYCKNSYQGKAAKEAGNLQEYFERKEANKETNFKNVCNQDIQKTSKRLHLLVFWMSWLYLQGYFGCTWLYLQGYFQTITPERRQIKSRKARK